MADVLVATRDQDRLFCSGSRLTVDEGVRVWFGYILTEGGGRIDVPNIEVLLQHGYWEELT